MNAGQRTLIVLGRIFISVIFIIGGINKILDWKVMEEGIVSTLCDWHSYMSGIPKAESCVEMMIDYAPLLLGAAVFLEIVGGLMVLFGTKVRWGAFFLFIFILPATIIFHHFWFLEGQKRDLETLMFLKNVAILGGIMILWAFGPIKRKIYYSPPPTGQPHP